MDKKKYYMTTAIAYTSAKPHIGNSYEVIMADAIARFKRREGYDVFFQTGTDEHGQKIEEKARAAGQDPQAYVDGVAKVVRDLCDLLDISYDKFMRTTDPYHKEQVQKIFKKLYDQGDIYLGAYEGLYCTPCESFWTQGQLVDGCCPSCGGPVTPAKEEAYFFAMSKYADRLIAHIESHPEFILPPSRKNEMMNNFLLPGLQDLCVSRTSFTWGIPVDFAPGHVVYVWLDALTNYITGIEFDAEGQHGPAYGQWWPADLHLIGKDIVRFHTIYWPIFLMALGQELPATVFGHPWLLQGEGKMSKSKGNVIYADQMVDVFGLDPVRYCVLREMPYDHDGSIGWELAVERINGDLANTLGNLVSRTVAMSNKYFGGTVRNPGAAGPEEALLDRELEEMASSMYDKMREKMDAYKVAEAMELLMGLFRRCNKYIDETTPWILAKDPEKQDRLATVLYHLVECVAIGANLLEPFMPRSAAKILEQLGDAPREYGQLGQFGLYAQGGKVAEQGEILFARLEREAVLERAEKILGLSGAEAAEQEQAEAVAPLAEEKTQAVEAKPSIPYGDFAKLQFLVGEILECKEVPKSKKLLCSQVRIGDKTKQILSGIKAYYSPEEMVGKRVMVLANLEPVKMAGLWSEGMLLCAEDAEGNLCLVAPEQPMPPGSVIC